MEQMYSRRRIAVCAARAVLVTETESCTAGVGMARYGD